MIYDGYEKFFIDHATDLRDAQGKVIGRAMMVSGWEAVHPDLRWAKPPEGLIYVGGFHADEIYFCMGAVCGEPLTADRLKAFPVASLDEFWEWMETQADRIRNSSSFTPFDRTELGFLARGFGAIAPKLPCALSSQSTVDHDRLVEWLDGRNEILLISGDSVVWLDRGYRPPIIMTFDGREVKAPDEGLWVNLNSQWYLPEEVLDRPKDERFADVIEPSAVWDPRTWWYDTGNFGSAGLVVRTIAEVWNIDVVEAVNLMEPLHLEDNGDLRLELNTTDGGTVRVTAIRMCRPVT